MSDDPRALPLPDNLKTADAQVTELARVWWNDDRPAMIIRPALQDPALMGGLLAELAWHFSAAYAEKHGLDQGEALVKIREGWTDGSGRFDAAKAEGSIP